MMLGDLKASLEGIGTTIEIRVPGGFEPGTSRLAPRPTTGSGHNYLSAERKLKLYGLAL